MVVYASTKAFKSVYLQLRSDVDALAGARHTQEPGKTLYPDPAHMSQGERRHFVRSVFAFVEAVGYQLRIKLCDVWADSFDAPHLLALQDLQVDVSRKGIAGTKPLKSASLNLVRLAIASYAHAIPDGPAIDCEGPGFHALARSVAVRDRLMHPRCVESILVSDQEVRDALMGFVWMHQTIEMLLTGMVAALELKQASLKRDVIPVAQDAEMTLREADDGARDDR